MADVLDLGAFDVMHLANVGTCVQQAIARCTKRLRSTDWKRAEALDAVARTLQTDWQGLDEETLRTLLRNADLDEASVEECGSLLVTELGHVILDEIARLEVRSEPGSSWAWDTPIGRFLADWHGLAEGYEEIVCTLAPHMCEGCAEILRGDPGRFALILEDLRGGFPALAPVLADMLSESLRDLIRTSRPDVAAPVLRQVGRVWNEEAHARFCRELKDDLVRLLRSSSTAPAIELFRAISPGVLDDIVRASIERLAETIMNAPAASAADLVSVLVLAPKAGGELVHRLRADLTRMMAAATPQERARLLLAVANVNRNVAYKIVRDLRRELEADLHTAPPEVVVRTFVAAGKADPDLASHSEYLRLAAAAFRKCPKDVRGRLLLELQLELGSFTARRFLNVVQPGLAAQVFGQAQRP